MMLYLAAKPSHVGADVDGLACFLHRPTVYSCQMGGQRFVTGASLSYHIAVGSGAFLGDAKPPRVWIFDVVLTIRVPERLNLTWRSSPLPELTYQTSELSWRLRVYPWKSCYVTRQWDGFLHSSTCC
jgi:hypothetical protein